MYLLSSLISCNYLRLPFIFRYTLTPLLLNPTTPLYRTLVTPLVYPPPLDVPMPPNFAPEKPRGSIYRLELWPLLCALVVKVIRTRKVLNIGIAYCKACILTTLLKRQLWVRAEVLEHYSTISIAIEKRTAFARHRGAIGA
jgi:hypothetical protein